MHSSVSRNTGISSFLFMILLAVNFIFILYPIDFDEALQRVNDSEISQNGVYLQSMALFNTIIFILLIIFNFSRVYIDKKLLPIFVIGFFLIISVLLSSINNTKFLVITLPISFIAVFIVFKYLKVYKGTLESLLICLIIWSAYPVISFIIRPWDLQYFSGDGINWISTFRGFAYHRNAYGFIAGMTILYLIILNKFKLSVNLLIIGIISFGIILSESRATIIAVIVMSTYYLSTSVKVFYFRMISLLSIFSILFYFAIDFISEMSTRGESTIFSADDRLALIEEFIIFFSDNLLFGLGGTVLSNNGDPVHNFIIQVMVSYGLLVSIPYFFLLWQIWKEGNKGFRTLFGYLLLFGLFQPYFQFGSISNYMLLLFIIAYMVENHLKTQQINKEFIK